MKIALIHFDLTTESGDPKHMLSVARGLKNIGHSVVVYCAEFDAKKCFPRLNNDLDIRAIPPSTPLSSLRGSNGMIKKISNRIRQVFFYNNLIKRVFKKIDKDFDFIICENDQSYKLGFFYKKINQKTKIVWIMHNPPFFHSPKKNIITNSLSYLMSLFEKISAKFYGRFIDWILVFDENARKLAKKVGPPVKVVRLPVDLEYFYFPNRPGIAPQKNINLLSLGALSPARRYEDTISAAVILRAKGYDAHVTLICKDYWNDKNYRQEFEDFIDQSSIKQYIDARFNGTTEKELLEIMKASNIFILPNNIKLWAIGAFEAMAVGLPLIVSRETAVIEILHDGVDALFVDAFRPDQIAEKVEALVLDPLLYSKISEVGKKLVKEKLSIESYICEMLATPLMKSNN